jgi:hypothetical protein
MKLDNIFFISLVVTLLTGCTSTGKHVVKYSSEHAITIGYHGFGILPIVTPEARDTAARHCAEYDRKAVYQDVTYGISTYELHNFTCEIDRVIVTQEN